MSLDSTDAMKRYRSCLPRRLRRTPSRREKESQVKTRGVRYSHCMAPWGIAAATEAQFCRCGVRDVVRLARQREQSHQGVRCLRAHYVTGLNPTTAK